MLHITLRQLQVFEKVASLLSHSRAAEVLFMSQPAVSMQIKQLEENIGLPLFEQMGKKIYLTDAGRELFHYSRNIAQQLADMEAVFDEMKGLGQGKINISVVNTANYFTPMLLAQFCQLHPSINVSLQVGNRDAVLKLLADNITDLAVMGRPPANLDLDLDYISFMDNPMVVVAPPTHALANQEFIELEQLAKETFVTREKGSGTRSAMERVFSQHQIRPRIGMEMETNEAIKQAVKAGMGLSVLSLHSIELELETKRLVMLNVERFPLMRHWYVVHRSNKRLSSAAGAFKDFLLEKSNAH